MNTVSAESVVHELCCIYKVHLFHYSALLQLAEHHCCFVKLLHMLLHILSHKKQSSNDDISQWCDTTHVQR